jgi:hypothetical protein
MVLPFRLGLGSDHPFIAAGLPRLGSQTQKLSTIAEAEIRVIIVPGKKFT